MSREVDRLRLENTALHSKVRELEATIQNCAALGIKLRHVLASYQRGDEPTPEDLADIAER